MADGQPDAPRPGWEPAVKKEDTMLTTVTGSCPLCGLRFGNRPLLELHIRDDHRRTPARQKGRPDGDDDEGSPEGQRG